MNDVVIELRGGVLVEVYCDDPSSRFVIVDWDRVEETKPMKIGVELTPCRLTEMPEETRIQLRTAVSSPQAEPSHIVEFA